MRPVFVPAFLLVVSDIWLLVFKGNQIPPSYQILLSFDHAGFSMPQFELKFFIIQPPKIFFSKQISNQVTNALFLSSQIQLSTLRTLRIQFSKSFGIFEFVYDRHRPRWFYYAAIRAEIFRNPAAEDLLFQANLQPGHERALSVQSNSAFHAKNPPYSIFKIFRHFRVCLRSPLRQLTRCRYLHIA